MYRSENVGIEMHRQRFEEAKAALEELAERRINLQRKI